MAPSIYSNASFKVRTERQIKVCTWLREISSSSCLTVLPGPAWVLCSKTCKPFFAPLDLIFFALELLQFSSEYGVTFSIARYRDRRHLCATQLLASIFCPRNCSWANGQVSVLNISTYYIASISCRQASHLTSRSNLHCTSVSTLRGTIVRALNLRWTINAHYLCLMAWV